MDRQSKAGERLVRLPIARPRAFAGPDGSTVPAQAAPSQADIATQFEQLNRTFAAFRDVNDRALAELRAGRADAVTTEHVDRINAQVTQHEATIAQLSSELAAARLSGGSGANAGQSAAQRRYNDAFRAALRSPLSAPQHIETMRSAAIEIGGVQDRKSVV